MSDLGPFSASLSGQQCVASKYPIPNKGENYGPHHCDWDNNYYDSDDDDDDDDV